MTDRDPPRDAHDAPDWLPGRWRLLRAEVGVELSPGTVMEFRERGDLLYTLVIEGRELHMALRYRVDGTVLCTESQGSHSSATPFSLGPGGLLVFDFAGAKALFVRESELR